AQVGHLAHPLGDHLGAVHPRQQRHLRRARSERGHRRSPHLRQPRLPRLRHQRPSPLLIESRMRELLDAADLCAPDGRLDRAAVGWSRRPLHRANLRGNALRKKRWEYWCITSDSDLFAVTVADVDYVGLVVVTSLDLATGELFERAAITPFGWGVRLGDTVCGE